MDTMTSPSPQTCVLPQSSRYYIFRGSTNNMVPLVPADQLPFPLHGIPQKLNHRQLSQESWIFAGESNEPVSPLSTLESPGYSSSPPTPQTASHYKFLAPDHISRNEPSSLADKIPLSRNTRSSPGPVQQMRLNSNTPAKVPVVDPLPTDRRRMNTESNHPNRSLTDNFAAVYQQDAQRLGYRKLPPSGIEPDQSKKEFCTHWIRTGDCAFVSIGCKYKHEMPPVEKLRQLGFTTVPKWFKEKTAIAPRGPTWMERQINREREGAVHHASVSSPVLTRSPVPPKTQSTGSEKSSKRISFGMKTGHVPAPPNATNGHESAAPFCDPQPIRRVSDLLIDITPQDASTNLATSPSLDNSLASESTQAPSTKHYALSILTPPDELLRRLELGGPPIEGLHQIRRHSQTSWTSDDDSSDGNQQLTEPMPTRRAAAHQTPNPSNSSLMVKKAGLLQSRHANINKAINHKVRRRQPRTIIL